MRNKDDYTIFPRYKKNGKAVYYYYVWVNGKRVRRSTGQESLTAARYHITTLIRQGKMLASDRAKFADWSQDWWDWDKCQYIHSRRGGISRNHADIQRGYLKNHLQPYFNNKIIQDLAPGDIEDWVRWMEKKGKSASLINHALATLKVMFNEAVRLKELDYNPAASVRKFPEKKKSRQLLTLEQAGKLFEDISLWDNNIVHYTLNMLAASTGMRLGECQALSWEQVLADHIHVDRTWTRKYRTKMTTKNGEIRDVPLSSKTRSNLTEIHELLPGPLLFSYDGKIPLDSSTVNNVLERALKRIEISDPKDRGLTFHSWRHWFNTYCRANGVPDAIIQRATGHLTQEMTEHYTSFQLEDFKQIKTLQEAIFGKN